MAIDVCSEITVISPRISFSHDLDRPHDAAAPIQRRLDSSLPDSASDFDFCFTGAGLVPELSSADELFSDGKILPIEIRKIPIPARQNRGSVPNSSRRRPAEKKMLKEFLSSSYEDEEEDGDEEKPAPSKPFWQFKRSSSLNCDNSSLIRSLHFLSRSNSTGSVPNPNPNPKESGQRQSLQKQGSVSSRKSSSSSSSSSSYAYYPYRPALRKCGSEGNGVRVLNLPPPYISRATVNLFGFGSIFCNGKFKGKKKK